MYFCKQTLSVIDLNDNRIGSMGMKHLVDALKYNTVMLILTRCFLHIYLHMRLIDTHLIQSQ